MHPSSQMHLRPVHQIWAKTNFRSKTNYSQTPQGPLEAFEERAATRASREAPKQLSEPLPNASIPPVSIHRAWPVVLAILLFGVLMAARHELSSVAARASITAVAFVTLGLALWYVNQPDE
jgi:hypothetical protein